MNDSKLNYALLNRALGFWNLANGRIYLGFVAVVRWPCMYVTIC